MIFILAAFEGYLVLASFMLDLHDLRFDCSPTFGSIYYSRKHEEVYQIQLRHWQNLEMCDCIMSATTDL